MLYEKRVRAWIWFAFSILCIFYAYEFFLRISPSVLVDQLLIQYKTSAIGIAAFSTSYFLGYLIMQVPAGLLLDRYGFKLITATALMTCAIGTLIFTFGHTVFIGFLGRFILGCGSAFAFIGAITFVRKYFSEKYFTLLVAMIISVGTITGAFGQVFAVQITHYLGWHFTIDGIAIWGCILAMMILLIPKKYLIQTNTTSHETKKLSVREELYFVLKTRALWVNGVIGSFLYLPTSVLAATWGVEFFNKAFSLNNTTGSIAITLLFIGWAMGGPFFSFINQRYHAEKFILSSGSIIAALLIGFILFQNSMTAITLYILLFLFGFFSSTQILVWRIFTLIVPNTSFVGVASSFTNLIIMLTVAVWDLGLGKIINTLSYQASNHAYLLTQIDIRKALSLLPILLLCVPFLTLLLPKFNK
jgi:MFS family permease